MFSLVSGFVVRKLKRFVTLEGADTSSSWEKRPRRSPSDEKAQQDREGLVGWATILMGSPNLASND